MVNRRIEDVVEAHLLEEAVLLIQGPRSVGKSTLRNNVLPHQFWWIDEYVKLTLEDDARSITNYRQGPALENVLMQIAGQTGQVLCQRSM